MPMKKLQHIRVTAFREPLRTYERDTKGIEEQSIRSNRNYSAILATPNVVTVDTGFASFSGDACFILWDEVPTMVEIAILLYFDSRSISLMD